MGTEPLALLGSRSWQDVRHGVEELGDALSQRALSAERRAAIEARLLDLVDHESWQVRVALARALRHLEHESLAVALAKLATDENPYVRKAASQSRARRFEVSKSEVLREREEAVWRRVLGRLQSQHGNSAREAAVRAAEKYTEFIVRATNHEVRKVIAPLDSALTKLLGELESPRFDRLRGLERAQRVKTRFDLLRTILDSLEQFVTEVKPAFQRERLADVLAEAVDLVRERGPDGTRLRARLDVKPAALEVDLHRVRLVLAFSNLIQNALEAYDEGAAAPLAIKARVDARREKATITFTDKGRGMSAQGLKDAFHLYASTKSRGGGFGLPFARKVVETEHRGSIHLASSTKGTTVTVVLPLPRKEVES